MINNISISNFQSHKNSQLDFHPGVNVIIGPSDSGKTAIIRALRWLVWNRPTGDAIRSWWGGDTKVALSLPTSSLSRVKGKENQYTLNGLTFKAVGTDVPEEIRDKLNLTDINLQQQLDRPFLLDSSPGEIAQHFNRVAQLDVIDRGLSNVQRWTRSVEQDLKARERQLRETEEALSQYDYLDEMERNVEAVEYLEKEVVSVRQQISRLSQVLQQIQDVKKAREPLAEIISIEKSVTEALTLAEQKRKVQNAHVQLTDLIDSIICNAVARAQIQKRLEVADLIDPAVMLLREKNDLIEQEEALSSLVKEIRTNDSKTRRITERLKTLVEQLPNTCPFCGQTMPEVL